MAEALLAIVVVAVSVAALALGLMLLGTPIRTACEGTACATGGRCPGCPNRRETDDA